MNFGFVRVSAVVPASKVADVQGNCDEAIRLIKQAADNHVSVVMFPELNITSYTCGDLFFSRTLIQGAMRGLKRVMEETKMLSITSILGMPVKVGDKLYNCAVVIAGGRILGIVPKTHLPNYNEFYEHRWFAAAEQGNTIDISYLDQQVPFGTDLIFSHADGMRFSIEICEDMWVNHAPAVSHTANGANVIFNLSASNAVVGKSDYIDALIKSRSLVGHCGYVYSSSGANESTTDTLYSGYIVIAENGAILLRNRENSFNSKMEIMDLDIERLSADRLKAENQLLFVENKSYRIIDIPIDSKPFGKLVRTVEPYPFIPKKNQAARMQEIFDIQTFSLAKRLKHAGNASPVIGISGGLDSTLALLVCAKAADLLKMPRSNIIAVTMPGFGTTDRTLTNAHKLMKQLEVTSLEIDIKLACKVHLNDIGLDLSDRSIAYENAQARERTQILMDVANKQGGLVIGTGDLSEMALGWATYGGDHLSMYGVNSGVPKTLVRHLVRWAGENLVHDNAVLLDVLDTPVSPELLPADDDGQISQRTEEIIGHYDIHDFFLYYFIRFGFTPKKMLYLANCAFEGMYRKEQIEDCLKTFISRFFHNQFKRSCLPDGPKIGSVTLSPRADWRMPSDAVKTLWMDW